LVPYNSQKRYSYFVTLYNKKKLSEIVVLGL